MSQEIIKIIRSNPMIYQFLREESYHYQYLYRDNTYIKKIESLAKEKYKQTSKDKLERLKNNIDLIQAFMSVMD